MKTYGRRHDMKDEDILDEYIHKYYLEDIVFDNNMKMLIADTFDFKIYLFKRRLVEAAKTILKRRN